MDIDILKEFLILSNANSFNDVAKSLGCSPSALRARISAFEESLGVQLLVRSSQGFELTDAGRKLIPAGRKIAELYESSIQKGRATSYMEYQSLSMVIAGFEIPLPLQERLIAFSEKYPAVHIHLLSDSDYSLREDLLSETIDLYFLYSDKDLFYEDLQLRPLWKTKPHMLVPEDHELSQKESVLLKDFDGECQILYPRTKVNTLREWQMAVRDESGITYTNYRNESSKEWSKYMIGLHKGVMIYPYSGGLLPPGTRAIPLADPHIRKLMISAVYVKDNPNPILKLFLDEVLSVQAGKENAGDN